MLEAGGLLFKGKEWKCLEIKEVPNRETSKSKKVNSTFCFSPEKALNLIIRTVWWEEMCLVKDPNLFTEKKKNWMKPRIITSFQGKHLTIYSKY